MSDERQSAKYPREIGMSTARGALAGMAGGALAAPLVHGGKLTSLKRLGGAAAGQTAGGAAAGAVLGTIFEAGKLQGRAEQISQDGRPNNLHPLDMGVAKGTRALLGDNMKDSVVRGAGAGALAGGGYAMRLAGNEAVPLRQRLTILAGGAGLGAIKGGLAGVGLGAIRDIGRGAGRREERLGQMELRKRADAPTDVPGLLATMGPPGEWSGAVAGAVSTEQRQDLLRAWRSMSAEERNTLIAKWRERFNAPAEKTAVALPVSKEKREATHRVDEHFRSEDPAKWDGFLENAKRKSFVAAVRQDVRADPKLERHTDQMNRLLTGKEVGKMQVGTGGEYSIVKLRGGGLGCTCPDWRYKKSVATTGEQDCKHVTAWKSKGGQKLADFQHAHALSAARHEVAGLGILAAPSAVHALQAGALMAAKLPGRAGKAGRLAATVLAPLSHALESNHGLLAHGIELAGLGVLARPSLQELRR